MGAEIRGQAAGRTDGSSKSAGFQERRSVRGQVASGRSGGGRGPSGVMPEDGGLLLLRAAARSARGAREARGGESKRCGTRAASTARRARGPACGGRGSARAARPCARLMGKLFRLEQAKENEAM